LGNPEKIAIIGAIVNSWTKGLILDKGQQTASAYEIKEIDGVTYMFFEWKTEDYFYRDLKPYYYVLRKK